MLRPMNKRRLERLRLLAQGAALVGIGATGCGKNDVDDHKPVINAPAPPMPSATDTGTSPQPFRRPIINAPRLPFDASAQSLDGGDGGKTSPTGN
jgi:hypothetical protein